MLPEETKYHEVWAEMMVVTEVERALAVIAGNAKIERMRVEYKVMLAWEEWEARAQEKSE